MLMIPAKIVERTWEAIVMQWEYYRLSTVESCLDEGLQELGKEGWELVSVLPEGRLFHGFQCVLKRPVPEGEPETAIKSQQPVPQRVNKYLSVR